jgi:hypothetical protein
MPANSRDMPLALDEREGLLEGLAGVDEVVRSTERVSNVRLLPRGV